MKLFRTQFGRALSLVPFALGAGPALAQDSPHPRVVTIDTVPAPALISSRDLKLGGIFVLTAAAMAPFDRSIARVAQRPALQTSSPLSRSANFFDAAGGVGTVAFAVAAYGAGRIAGSDHLARLGLYTGEAIVASAGVTTAIKIAGGRQRPWRAGTADADDFSFGRGLSEGYSSFPSGHATSAFATATVVTLEASDWWPGSARYVGPVMFTGATLVGASRIYTNAHWASDVVLGAGIGTLTAMKVVQFNAASPRNRINRFFLAAIPAVAPDGFGATRVSWTMAAPR